MKSDRRHELQTNELASMLTHGLERYRSQLPTIGLVAVVVLLAVVAIGFWTSTRGNSTANAHDRSRQTDRGTGVTSTRWYE